MTLSASPSVSPQEQYTRLQTVSRLLQEGRRAEAAAALRVLITMAPRQAEAHRGGRR